MVYCPSCGMKSPENKKFCGECGTSLVPPATVSHTSVRAYEKEAYQLRINIFCLVGAVLAVLALFLPWAQIHTEGASAIDNLGPYDFGNTEEGNPAFPSNLRYSVTLFLVGTILAFFTPLGGILQFIGSFGFILAVSTATIEGIELEYWIGAIVGFVASIMVLLTITNPVGVGYEEGKISPIGRLLTVSAYRQPISSIEE